MRPYLRIGLTLLLVPVILAVLVGFLVAPAFLHPVRRLLTPDLVQQANVSFAEVGTKPEAFDVRAGDGVLLRGWKVRAAKPNGAWVLLFHGVADNRMGVVEHALVLLKAGYSVTLMDARAHGQSEGAIATYGWLERNDTRSIIDAVVASEHPAHIFALGESMGAGIALQSAGVDPRIEAVVAEAPFASLREASYDYAGLQKFHWLGATLFAPGAWVMLARGEALARFPAAGVSPEHAVATRAFPVMLICDGDDTTLPCRHAERIYAAALGPKSLWVVPKAYHTAALGYEREEFKRRVLQFFGDWSAAR
jgi:uncharacterized protein